MQTWGRSFPLRAWNAARRILAGLGLRGECVWPGVRNDLFLAHYSIYQFFSLHTAGLKILDAGCGTGYGSHLLAARGSESVLGVDIDPRNIRYARRRFSHPHLSYSVADCERLDQALALQPGGLDAIVSSNVLEHLHEPGRFLDIAQGILAPDGFMLLVIPAITNPGLLKANEDIPFHVSNLYVDEWLSLFREHGWDPQIFRHDYRPGIERLDFSSPFRSQATAEDFLFLPSTRDDLYNKPTLGGVYLLQRQS